MIYETETILFASLVAMMILPFSVNIAHTNVIDDDLLILQYDRIFGNDENISNQTKIQVILSMMNATEIQPSTPQDQDKVAQQVLELIRQRDNAKSDEERIKFQEKLDEKTELMLQVGLVLVEEYEKDPDKWDKALDEAFVSKQGAKIEENKGHDTKPVAYDEDFGNLTLANPDVPSLKEQLVDHIPINEIKCNDGKIPTQRDDGRLACVYFGTAVRLDWSVLDDGIHFAHFIENGTVNEIIQNRNESIQITIDAIDDGYLLMQIPGRLLDYMTPDPEKFFFVNIDGMMGTWTQFAEPDAGYKNLAIYFKQGDTVIDFFSVNPVPTDES